jgi:glycosyltransferase involved in cell wall biosynthesis
VRELDLKHNARKSSSEISVLMVSTFPPDRDGIAAYTSRLTSALRKENIVVRNAVNGRDWKRNSLMYIFTIIRKSIASKTCIVHIQLSYFMFGNEYYTSLFPVLSLCLKLIGKSVVVTIHDIVPKSNITNDFLKNYTSPHFLEFKRWALFYYTIIVCSIVDKLILHSEIAQNVLTQDYAVPKKKINIIPHGIDHLSFPVNKDHGKPKSLVYEGCKLVSYFGLVRRGKGLEDLVRAWKKTENMNAQLFIIGGKHPALKDNCYEDLTILTKALGLEKSIRFCGYIPPESLSTYFIESDAFVFPYNEWGDVIASSGALSIVAPYLKPIIATDVPAFDDLKKMGAAIIVRRGNVDGLASAINQVLADTQIRNSLVTRLNGWLLEGGWAKVAEKTAALYRELV